MDKRPYGTEMPRVLSKGSVTHDIISVNICVFYRQTCLLKQCVSSGMPPPPHPPFSPPQLVWQRSNKKPLYVYQIWGNDSVTPQNLEITFTFGSQPDTRENVPRHSLFISKKTLWFGGLPSQSSITTHLH